jgi:ATP-dependent Clp protease ATP-binding subunit ClpA
VSDLFDRCDPDTVAVLDTALADARRLGHSWLGTEHVLLALVQHCDRLPEGVGQLLPSVAKVRAALDAEIDGPPPPDAELLRTLGIDLDAVRTTVSRTFGSDALDRLAHRRVPQPWQPWRRPRRRCVSLLAGQMSVAPRLKQALEHAANEADRRRRPMIDPAGLLLGMIETEDAMANQLLRHAGVDPHDVRAALHATSRTA